MIDIDKTKALSPTELRFHRDIADERLAAITERLDKKGIKYSRLPNNYNDWISIYIPENSQFINYSDDELHFRYTYINIQTAISDGKVGYKITDGVGNLLEYSDDYPLFPLDLVDTCINVVEQYIKWIESLYNSKHLRHLVKCDGLLNIKTWVLSK